MSWTLELLPEAEDDFDALPKLMRTRVAERLKELTLDPRGPGTRPLSGSLKGCHRARVGDYRIGYCLHEPEQLVSIWAIGHRGRFYKLAERREKQ